MTIMAIIYTIDDWWHRENNSIFVINDRIQWLVLYDGKVLAEMRILLY